MAFERDKRIEEKYAELIRYLQGLKSVAVAFSGGVDSGFLLKAAKDALGTQATAVTAQSVLTPREEVEQTVSFCASEQIRHILYQYDSLSVKGLSENTRERCYYCKKSFFTGLRHIATEQGINFVLEGSNLDDEGDYRPGMRAVRELGIVSPLKELGWTKQQIRQMSERLGLSFWNKPGSACLASRIAYGEEITEEKLSMIEKSERFLHRSGFSQVRVRMHENLARIEVMPEQLPELMLKREQITNTLLSYGFRYISVDLEGYRTGSMN